MVDVRKFESGLSIGVSGNRVRKLEVDRVKPRRGCAAEGGER